MTNKTILVRLILSPFLLVCLILYTFYYWARFVFNIDKYDTVEDIYNILKNRKLRKYDPNRVSF